MQAKKNDSQNAPPNNIISQKPVLQKDTPNPFKIVMPERADHKYRRFGLENQEGHFNCFLNVCL